MRHVAARRRCAGPAYKYVMNIDISRACVIAQLERYASGPHRNNKFMHGNACALEFPDESFDLVIAKATLDVIRCGKGAEGNVHAVCREVSRVLRPGGRFLVVSHADDWEEVSRRVSERDAGDARRAFGWTLERYMRRQQGGRAAVAGRAQGRRPEGLLAGRAGGAAAARERAGVTNLLFLNLESSVVGPSARWRGGRRIGQEGHSAECLEFGLSRVEGRRPLVGPHRRGPLPRSHH